jgi:hypothetical protein
MTLVTLIYGRFLDRGRRLYFVGSLTPSIKPDEPDAESKSPIPMRSLRPLAVSGSSNLPANQTPLPDDGYPCRRVDEEHRRVSYYDPTTTNPLLMPDTPAIVRFVGLCEKV